MQLQGSVVGECQRHQARAGGRLSLGPAVSRGLPWHRAGCAAAAGPLSSCTEYVHFRHSMPLLYPRRGPGWESRDMLNLNVILRAASSLLPLPHCLPAGDGILWKARRREGPPGCCVSPHAHVGYGSVARRAVLRTRARPPTADSPPAARASDARAVPQMHVPMTPAVSCLPHCSSGEGACGVRIEATPRTWKAAHPIARTQCREPGYV
jgi:hypothetical protein